MAAASTEGKNKRVWAYDHPPLIPYHFCLILKSRNYLEKSSQ